MGRGKLAGWGTLIAGSGHAQHCSSVQLTSWGQYWQGWYESSTAGSYRGCGTVGVYNGESFWAPSDPFFPMGMLSLMGHLLALDPACAHSPGSGNTGVWCIGIDGTKTQQRSGVQALTGGRWLRVPACWLVHNGGGPSISGAWGCSYHGAGIRSIGATTTARVLGPGVCTGLREAAGSPGPRAAPSGEGRIRRSGISLPRGSCGDGCWVTPWWKRPASSVEWATGARARYHYRLLCCESCGEAAAATGAV